MAMTLITTNPDSTDVASVDFTSGIDSTYKLYIFKFYDCNPATDGTHFTFQANAAGGSGFNETMTTTFFEAWHTESDSSSGLGYHASYDLAQGTAYQTINYGIANYADSSVAGELYLFNPSNTTYVKHFYSSSNGMVAAVSVNTFAGGYINTTSAIDEISFKFSSGNMDGVIKMYGVG